MQTNTNIQGNIITGYDFTIRGKKQRDSFIGEVFSRKEIPSIFQLVVKQQQVPVQMENPNPDPIADNN